MFPFKYLKNVVIRNRRNRMISSITELIEKLGEGIICIDQFNFELEKIVPLADSDLPPAVNKKINAAKRREKGKRLLKWLKGEIINLDRFYQLIDEIGGREAAGIAGKDILEAQNTVQKIILKEYESGMINKRISYSRLGQIFGPQNSLEFHKWLSDHAPPDKDTEHQPQVGRPPARPKPVWPINQCANTGRFLGARNPSVNLVSNAHP